MANYFYINGSNPSSENSDKLVKYTNDNCHVNNLVGLENELSNNGISELERLNSYFNEHVDSYTKVQRSNNSTNQYLDVTYLKLLENLEDSRYYRNNFCHVNNFVASENEFSNYGISEEGTRNSLSCDTNNSRAQYLETPYPELRNELRESLKNLENSRINYSHVNNSVTSENEFSNYCSSEEDTRNNLSYEYVDGNAKVQNTNNYITQYSDPPYPELRNDLWKSLEDLETPSINYSHDNSSVTAENEFSNYCSNEESTGKILSYESVDGNAKVQDTNNSITQYSETPLPELSSELLESLEDLGNYRVNYCHVTDSATPENKFSNYGSSEKGTQNNFHYVYTVSIAKAEDPNNSITQYSVTTCPEVNNELLESLEDSRNCRVDNCHVNNYVRSENELSSSNSSKSKTQKSYTNEHIDVGGIVQSPSSNSNQYSDAVNLNSHNDQPFELKQYIMSLKATVQSLHNIENCDEENYSQVYDATPKPFIQVLDYHSPNEKTLPSIEHQHQQKSLAEVVLENQESCTSNQSQRRNRTKYTTEQTIILENAFIENQYLNILEREALSEQLNIDEKRIKVWFQNRRQKEVAKERKGVKKVKSASAVPVADYSQKIADILKKLKCNSNS